MPEQNPDNPIQIERTISAHGGMDTYNAPWLMDENSFGLLQNVDPSVPGQRSVIEGAATIGAATGTSDALAPAGIWPFYDDDWGQEIIQGIVDGQLYNMAGGSQLVQVASAVSFTQTLHNSAQGRFGGKRASYIYTSTKSDSSASVATDLFVIDVNRSWTQVASMAPRSATWWQGRLWCANNVLAQDEDTLWWSELDDGMSYSAINTMRIEAGRGGDLMAIKPVRAASPNLILFKEKLTAMLSVAWGSSSSLIPSAADALDTVASQVTIIADAYGTVAPNSIQDIEGTEMGDIIFLAHDGFRTIKRAADDTVAGASLPISVKIKDTIDRINMAHAYKAVSAVVDLKYHCAVPLDGAKHNSHIITLDILNGSWYLNDWDARALAPSILNLTKDQLWVQWGDVTTDTVSTGAGTGYHTFRAFNGNANPGGLPPRYLEESKAYMLNSLSHKKRWSWLAVEVKNAGATCTLGIDYRLDNDRWFELGELEFEPSGGMHVVLGETPLPWQNRQSGVTLKKFNLEDIQPSYMLQVRLTQSNVSDWGRPTIVQTMVGARIIDREFDNLIT